MKNILTWLSALVFLSSSVECAAQSLSESQTTAQYGSNPSAGRYISTRGFRMYVETYGKGQPLLVIHGNGGSMADMANQLTYFSKSYNVIAADSRSQGKSADPSDSLSYEMMADDYNALMDSLHIDSANIVGWSDGGIIGLLLAIRHPEKVRKLAVTGANIRPDTSAFSANDMQWMKNHADKLSGQRPDPGVKNELKLTRLMIDEPNISGALLGKIRCPVLVIGGDHDIIKPAHTLEIYQSIPNAFLWILPGAGHDTCIKFKDDFNFQVERFFRK